MEARFDRDTAVVPHRQGIYSARIDEGWWIVRSPNGGYLTAIIMQALTAEIGDPERHARSLTVHYLARAVAGPIDIEVRTERAGRAVSFLTARVQQDGRLLAIALATFASLNADSPSFADETFPDYPPPHAIESPSDLVTRVPMHSQYEYKHVVGAPSTTPSGRAETGGWIRLREPRPYDAALVSAIADAWPPAIFARLPNPAGLPTLDLTVHFRSVRALRRMEPEDWIAVRFRTTVANEGFLEEDGELWAPDGTLVAHSRQLGLILVG